MYLYMRENTDKHKNVSLLQCRLHKTYTVREPHLPGMLNMHSKELVHYLQNNDASMYTDFANK